MAGMIAAESWVGVDLGGDRSTTVLQNGDIVRSEIGGHDTASLVAFKPRERLVGEAAVSMVTTSPSNTISAVHTMAGSKYSTWSERSLAQHLAFAHADAGGELGGVAITVQRHGGAQVFNGTELLAMYLGKLRACAEEKLGMSREGAAESNGSTSACKGCFSSPDWATISERKALLDAAKIAGFAEAKAFPASECLCAAYAKKHPVSPDAEPEITLMVDMGRLQTSVFVARFGLSLPAENGEGQGDGGADEAEPSREEAGSKKEQQQTVREGGTGCPFSVLKVASDHDLGAFSFDQRMFEHFREKVKQKHGQDIVPKTKPGLRLLLSCRRLRELLSTTPVAQTSCENLIDGMDVPLSITREELASLCEGELERLRTIVRGCLEGASVGKDSLRAVQALGGGCRMPVVQEVIGSEVGLPLGCKMDSASLAYGAALLGAAEGSSVAAPAEDAAEGGAVAGMSEEALAKAIEREAELQRQDAEMQAIALERNGIESLLLDMRSAPSKKHGQLLNRASLDGVLDGLEEWLYSEEAEEADLPALKAKRQKVDGDLKEGVAKEYFLALEADRRKVEEELEAEAKAAEEERKRNPEEEGDHDTRKLPKPERMRLVKKNKEEGTELFQGQNYTAAGARYSKALVHAAKMFDLSAEEKEEVDAVQLSLYLNLAQCYIKLQKWDKVTNNCALALKIDPVSTKALYRRAYALVAKKDYDAARADLLLAQKGAPGDKAVASLLKKVDETLKKQQQRERKMWSKAFS